MMRDGEGVGMLRRSAPALSLSATTLVALMVLQLGRAAPWQGMDRALFKTNPGWRPSIRGIGHLSLRSARTNTRAHPMARTLSHISPIHLAACNI